MEEQNSQSGETIVKVKGKRRVFPKPPYEAVTGSEKGWIKNPNQNGEWLARTPGKQPFSVKLKKKGRGFAVWIDDTHKQRLQDMSEMEFKVVSLDQ